MLLLHAGILNGLSVIWAERPFAASASDLIATAEVSARHPFCEDHSGLIQAVFEGEKNGDYKEIEMRAWLPSAPSTPLPSNEILNSTNATLPAKNIALRWWELDAIVLSADLLFDLLHSARSAHVLRSGILLSGEFQYLKLLTEFAVSLVIRQRFIPAMELRGEQFFARWQPVFLKEDQAALSELAKTMPAVMRAVSSKDGTHGEGTVPDSHPFSVLKQFIGNLVDYLVRATAQSIPRQLRTTGFNIPRADSDFDSVHDCWLDALRTESGLMNYPQKELETFSRQLEEWQRPVTAVEAAPFRLCFRLEEPMEYEFGAPEPTDFDEGWRVTYFLQDVNDSSLLVPAAAAWRNDETLLTAFSSHKLKPREYLLLSLGQASRFSPEVSDSLKLSSPDGFGLDVNGAMDFLSRKAWALEQVGFGVLLPSWWTKPRSRLRMKGIIKPTAALKTKGTLGLDQVVRFDWQAAIGDEPLTLEELLAIAEMKTELVNVRGQWVHVDSEDIKAAIDFLKQKAMQVATLEDAMKISIGVASPFDNGEVVLEAEGWVADLLKQLQEPGAVASIAPPNEFRGTLRPYQERGFSWLSFLSKWGLGACLADDMGLGKTVQTLVTIQNQKAAGEKQPVLLVCPTSVVNNWRKEADKFTPGLSVLIHHGATRTKGDKFGELVRKHDLVISSYALLHRDAEHFKKIEWSGIVLDEAQNIKNPGTKQSIAARQLDGKYRIALTGTPVENNVGDLWSIMEFLNPGFLGSVTQFRKKFFYPIQVSRSKDAQEKLKRITQPFILRRLKTDKSIIDDLPEKQEMKVYCTLTKEQVTLYEAVLKDVHVKLETLDGNQRRGLILQTLTRLKQVCNHPAQFLADNSELEARSGKLERLLEMLEEVLAAGEKSLIFSQYAEMGDMIRKHIEENLGEEVLFLHGEVNKKKRDEMVERFQSADGPSIFMLSLKAGGTGLNLTAANHVFHFDRWWNPAVENQATDRAFRIGQKRNVQVRKFVCAGTVEEKIDDMIETKRVLAEDVVSTGEGWITEMSNDELRKVFALSKQEALGD